MIDAAATEGMLRSKGEAVLLFIVTAESIVNTLEPVDWQDEVRSRLAMIDAAMEECFCNVLAATPFRTADHAKTCIEHELKPVFVAANALKDDLDARRARRVLH
jgi:hypothetical protein